MSDPGLAAQIALYTALNAALALGSPVLAQVYDGKAPQGASYPYVIIGDENTANRDFLSSRMEDRFVTLSIWSRYQGKAEIRTIISAIDAALHDARLTLTTGNIVGCRILRERITTDADDRTYMGSITLQVTTEH